MCVRRFIRLWIVTLIHLLKALMIPLAAHFNRRQTHLVRSTFYRVKALVVVAVVALIVESFAVLVFF